MSIFKVKIIETLESEVSIEADTLHRNEAPEEQEEIMITINSVEDVPVFLGCIALTEHLKDKVKQMLTTLETDNLEPYGSIYVIQFESDWNISTEIRLVEPLKDTPVEFAEIHTLDNGHGGTIDVFHGCFCLSNDFSFDVYCPMYLMDEKAFYEWTANLVGGKK